MFSKKLITTHKFNKLGKNNPMFGKKKWSEERRKKIVKPIYAYDSNTF